MALSKSVQCKQAKLRLLEDPESRVRFADTFHERGMVLFDLIWDGESVFCDNELILSRTREPFLEKPRVFSCVRIVLSGVGFDFSPISVPEGGLVLESGVIISKSFRNLWDIF